MEIREKRILLFVSFLCEDGLGSKNLEELYKRGAKFVDEHEDCWTDIYGVDPETGENTAVGFICSWPMSEDANLRAIAALYVDVNNRGRSYGTHLLEGALRQYPDANWCYLVPKSNNYGRLFMTHKFIENGYSSYRITSKQTLKDSILYAWQPDSARTAVLREAVD